MRKHPPPFSYLPCYRFPSSTLCCYKRSCCWGSDGRWKRVLLCIPKHIHSPESSNADKRVLLGCERWWLSSWNLLGDADRRFNWVFIPLHFLVKWRRLFFFDRSNRHQHLPFSEQLNGRVNVFKGRTKLLLKWWCRWNSREKDWENFDILESFFYSVHFIQFQVGEFLYTHRLPLSNWRIIDILNKLHNETRLKNFINPNWWNTQR